MVSREPLFIPLILYRLESLKRRGGVGRNALYDSGNELKRQTDLKRKGEGEKTLEINCVLVKVTWLKIQ